MGNFQQESSKLKHHNKYPLIIFFIFSLIPFYWLRNFPVAFGDAGLRIFFYNPEYLSNIYKYTWIPDSLTGYPCGHRITMLPLSGFFKLLASLGFNSYTQQAFVFSLILFTSMIFMYLFVYEFFDYRLDKRLIAIVSAIFYAFNPLTMIIYWYRARHSIYLIAFVPLILFLFLFM